MGLSLLEVIPLADYRLNPQSYRLPKAHITLSSGDLVVIVDESQPDWVFVPYKHDVHDSPSGLALADTPQGEPAVVLAMSVGKDQRIWVLEP